MPKSLAEYLGVVDPVHPEAPVGDPPSKNVPIESFCREILTTPQYREFLLRRILVDELPSQIESLLYYYAYGKPVERVEMTSKSNPLEEATPEQLETRLLHLADIARQLKHSEPATNQNKGTDSESVH